MQQNIWLYKSRNNFHNATSLMVKLIISLLVKISKFYSDKFSELGDGMAFEVSFLFCNT